MFTLRYKFALTVPIVVALGVLPPLIHYVYGHVGMGDSYAELNWTDYAYFGTCCILAVFVGFGLAILIWVSKKASNEKEKI